MTPKQMTVALMAASIYASRTSATTTPAEQTQIAAQAIVEAQTLLTQTVKVVKAS